MCAILQSFEKQIQNQLERASLNKTTYNYQSHKVIIFINQCRLQLLERTSTAAMSNCKEAEVHDEHTTRTYYFLLENG